MSIFSIFSLQPRTAAPSTTAPVVPQPTASTPQEPSSAPQAPARPPTASNWNFSLSAAAGLSIRNFGNNLEDPSLAWAVRLCGGARQQLSSRLAWTPGLCFTHEGLTGRQSASVDSIAASAQLNIQAFERLNIDIGLQLGASHLGSTANLMGTEGLFYGNNPLAYSTDNWGFMAAGQLGAQFRLLDSSSARLYLGAAYTLGANFWRLTPDAIDRSPADTAIPVDSVFHQLTAGLTLLIGPRPAARAATAETRPAQVATATAPAPSSPTPAPSTAPAPATAPVVNTTTRTHIDPIAFTSTSNRVANARALRNAIQALANSIHLGDGLNSTPAIVGINFTLDYSANNQGTVRINHIRMGDDVSYSLGRDGNFPASLPEGVLIRIETLIREMTSHTPHGIPTYRTGNYHVTLRRNTDGTITTNTF